MEIAWALLVVSSDGQVETLQHQRSWAERTAAEHGWHLGRMVEGVSSGNAGTRRLVRDLLLDIRATPAAVRPARVLMIRLDRLGRGNIVEAQVLLRELLGLGVRVYTRDAGEVRLDSAMDELIAAVQLAVARHENDVRRDKIRAVNRRRREAGQIVNNNSPYGLVLDEQRQYRALPEHRAVIAEAFRQRTVGFSLAKIASWLQDHAPPHSYKNGNSHLVPWRNVRVWNLLRQRSYVGTIVDEATFLKAQRVVRTLGTARRSNDAPVFVLGGALRCTCGYAVTGTSIRKANGEVRFRHYSCKATRNHRFSMYYHRAADLESRFEKFLLEVSTRPERYLSKRTFGATTPMLHALSKRIERLKSSLVRLTEQREKVWKLAQTLEIDALTIEERFAALSEKQSRIEDKLIPLLEEQTLMMSARDADARTVELLRSAHDRWLASGENDRKHLAREVAVAFGGLRLTSAGEITVGAATRDLRVRKWRDAAP